MALSNSLHQHFQQKDNKIYWKSSTPPKQNNRPLHTVAPDTTECPGQHFLRMAVHIPGENKIYAQLQRIYTKGVGWSLFVLVINQEQAKATTNLSLIHQEQGKATTKSSCCIA